MAAYCCGGIWYVASIVATGFQATGSLKVAGTSVSLDESSGADEFCERV